MGKNIRIISRLDIKGDNLVKGIHLEGLRVLGKPDFFSEYYYKNNIDEILYVDIVASLYNRNNISEIVEKTARDISIPMTVAGGLRTIDDIKSILRVGADKVAINTAAIKNPQIIKEASNKFGSSTIIASIEAIKQQDGNYMAYIDNGREYTGIDVFNWAEQVETLGAGEILITSVDKEGTGLGYDIELTKRVSESVSIPVIACGGAGNLEHIRDVIVGGKADAVAVASMLHYAAVNATNFQYASSDEGNIEFLKHKNSFSCVTPHNTQSIKKFLYKKGINCRYSN